MGELKIDQEFYDAFKKLLIALKDCTLAVNLLNLSYLLV